MTGPAMERERAFGRRDPEQALSEIRELAEMVWGNPWDLETVRTIALSYAALAGEQRPDRRPDEKPWTRLAREIDDRLVQLRGTDTEETS